MTSHLHHRYLNKKSGTSGLAKDDVQEWWRMEWVDAASGWGFHWEEDEQAAHRDGLFDPAEPYDRIREFNMARYLMQKVGANNFIRDRRRDSKLAWYLTQKVGALS